MRRIISGVAAGAALVVVACHSAKTAAFVSPSRAVYFGSVTLLHDLRMVLRPAPRGYVVMARISLKTVEINVARWPTITGDVGVIYGSPTGGRARLRLSWSNQDTAITSDVPSEAGATAKRLGATEV